eukprot:GHVS01025511.1.p1 GENE.GHVS01025511.1~~GHVS01025511.1.p1  ORF type:complete len:553 (-),score=40.27 GHVS01025511.1:85-1743(-)
MDRMSGLRNGLGMKDEQDLSQSLSAVAAKPRELMPPKLERLSNLQHEKTFPANKRIRLTSDTESIATPVRLVEESATDGQQQQSDGHSNASGNHGGPSVGSLIVRQLPIQTQCTISGSAGQMDMPNGEVPRRNRRKMSTPRRIERSATDGQQQQSDRQSNPSGNHKGQDRQATPTTELGGKSEEAFKSSSVKGSDNNQLHRKTTKDLPFSPIEADTTGVEKNSEVLLRTEDYPVTNFTIQMTYDAASGKFKHFYGKSDAENASFWMESKFRSQAADSVELHGIDKAVYNVDVIYVTPEGTRTSTIAYRFEHNEGGAVHHRQERIVDTAQEVWEIGKTLTDKIRNTTHVSGFYTTCDTGTYVLFYDPKKEDHMKVKSDNDTTIRFSKPLKHCPIRIEAPGKYVSTDFKVKAKGNNQKGPLYLAYFFPTIKQLAPARVAYEDGFCLATFDVEGNIEWRYSLQLRFNAACEDKPRDFVAVAECKRHNTGICSLMTNSEKARNGGSITVFIDTKKNDGIDGTVSYNVGVGNTVSWEAEHHSGICKMHKNVRLFCFN